ncbi:MAG: hypothetical protein KatS3mg059_0158 [Thermomicrobiales bacterium]|nr:MAG: hypothetical protein KatS3mg059_0158 [Thermomicrobiales bacterium]
MPGIPSSIGQYPVTGFADALSPGNLDGKAKRFGGELPVVCIELVERGDMPARNNQNVYRRLRMNVAKCHGVR